MHIGFLTPEYPHDAFNAAAGLGTSIKNLAEALIDEGHSVTVFVINQDTSTQFEENGIVFHGIAKRSYRFGGFYFYRRHVAAYVNQNCEGIDIIETPDWTGITAFCSFKVPQVVKIHGSDTYFCHLEKRPQKKKNRWFESLALKGADGICAVSSFSGNVTKSLFNLESTIDTCYNIIDTDKFQPVSTLSEEKYILNFGSIIRKKGVIELARAFNEVHTSKPDVYLYYLGNDVIDVLTGLSTSELIKRELTESARKQVKFLPKVPYEQVLKYISQAQVISLPSHAEAFPMTWLEAMAMQKPLVASNVGWSQEIISDGVNGYAVDPYDTSTLSSRLLSLLDSEKQRDVISQAARATILNDFNTNELINLHLDFYTKIIGQINGQ